MPDPRAFLKGFKITKGLVIKNWKIANVKIGHNIIERYRVYHFPIQILLTKTSSKEEEKVLSPDSVISALQAFVDENKGVIVNSRYGNPYKCEFGTISLSTSQQPIDYPRSILVSSLGTAIRIPKIV